LGCSHLRAGRRERRRDAAPYDSGEVSSSDEVLEKVLEEGAPMPEWVTWKKSRTVTIRRKKDRYMSLRKGKNKMKGVCPSGREGLNLSPN